MKQAQALMSLDLFNTLSEKQQRLYLGEAAISLGWGGISFLSKTYHVARNTVSAGVKAVRNNEKYNPEDGERKKGGGRNPIEKIYPGIDELVVKIAKSSSYGSPTDERMWTTMSTVKIADKLKEDHDIQIHPTTVLKILRRNKMSRQQNQKMLQNGTPDPDRDKQFKFIKKETQQVAAKGGIVLHGDVKKRAHREL